MADAQNGGHQSMIDHREWVMGSASKPSRLLTFATMFAVAPFLLAFGMIALVGGMLPRRRGLNDSASDREGEPK